MSKGRFWIFLGLFALLVGLGTVAGAERPKGETLTYLQLAEDVYLPEQPANKLPLVFFVHNGGANKEGWGDYPRELAAQGYLTVALNWDNWQMYDLEKAIDFTLAKYTGKIDTERIAFVGGCHGGLKCLNLFGYKDLKYKIKTMVVLSVAEEDPGMIQTLGNPHPPVLAFYSLQDHLGEYYQKVTQKIAEQLITQPKTVISLDATGHGNEMLIDRATQNAVRAKITAWLKDYLK